MKTFLIKMWILVSVLAFSAASFAQQPLSGDEIKKLVSGYTVEQIQFVPKNAKYLNYYDADGSIMSLNESGGEYKGKWRVTEDSQLCIQWPSRSESCVQIIKEPDGTYKRVSNGEVRAIMKSITPGKMN